MIEFREAETVQEFYKGINAWRKENQEWESLIKDKNGNHFITRNATTEIW